MAVDKIAQPEGGCDDEMRSLSAVERCALAQSGRARLQYAPREKLPCVEVASFPLLGKLTALRFLEWAQDNPEGVVSLPTGRTPEHFIKWTKHFLRCWDEPDVQEFLDSSGLQVAKGKPRLEGLTFVQMDEFYPCNPAHHNSFNYYLRTFYLEPLGLDPKKAILMDAWTVGCLNGQTAQDVFPELVDLTLRFRKPGSAIEAAQARVLAAVDNYCSDYERRIRALGGIGFWLGGIGPDGHIAFNCRGCGHFEPTRLTELNYESQAAASTDLGGIEYARQRKVVTIGLATITYNPEAVAIVFAAGDSKAAIVAKAIEGEQTTDVPASALHSLQHARFFLARSAASRLYERCLEDFKRKDQSEWKVSSSSWPPEVEQRIIDVALRLGKRIIDLDEADLHGDAFTGHLFARRNIHVASLLLSISNSLKAKLEQGLTQLSEQIVIHTAPHHDDIMLGYLPKVQQLLNEPSNENHFIYATSGFNAVTNTFMIQLLRNAKDHLQTDEFRELCKEGYFRNNRLQSDADVHAYLEAHAAMCESAKATAASRRLLRALWAVLGDDAQLSDTGHHTMSASSNGSASPSVEDYLSPDWFDKAATRALEYFQSQFPGQKDIPLYQQLKGSMREFEADLLWGYHGETPSMTVHHARLGFYKGDLFTEEPTIQRDVAPVLRIMEVRRPSVVTVALDPEGSGPDTHYKVLQTVATACKTYYEKVTHPTHDFALVLRGIIDVIAAL
mmetsp:Transcript_8440/g.31116  ORF Transcript_8440/g.31116 Transcript_8440/m.31116 type:complete len:729 (+) Transcript_8440:55-2241(+)